jgi:hypothetical protein
MRNLQTRINDQGGAYNVLIGTKTNVPIGVYYWRTIDWYGPHLFDLPLRDPLRIAWQLRQETKGARR